MMIPLQFCKFSFRPREMCSTTVVTNNGSRSFGSEESVLESGQLRLLAFSHELGCCSFNGPASISGDEAEVEVCRAAIFALMILCAGRIGQTAGVAGPHEQPMSAPMRWSMARRAGQVLLWCDQASVIKLARCDGVQGRDGVKPHARIVGRVF